MRLAISTAFLSLLSVINFKDKVREIAADKKDLSSKMANTRNKVNTTSLCESDLKIQQESLQDYEWGAKSWIFESIFN